jgi:heterodisulfide reductase subunit B
MKQYAYYPGCSLESMAASYDTSSKEVARKLGLDFQELEDWNCCGATAYFHIDEILATTLCARNLAMAEKRNCDVVAPCSGCYKNLYFANEHLKREPDLAEHVNFALQEDNLEYSGTCRVRHVLEVFLEDVGLRKIARRVSHPLEGLRVAAYYGCQIVRPRKNGENVEDPGFFEELMTTIGATPVDFRGRLRCCGASLIITSRKAAYSMVRSLLQSAVDAEADVIATACPLCQINLECHQASINREFGTDFKMPVVYFTQLLGMALGLTPKEVAIGKEFLAPTRALECARRRPAAGRK